jgi:hypothetical protein
MTEIQDQSAPRKVLTGVGAFICCAHRDAIGRLHGHTYEIVAWFPECNDASSLQNALHQACADFDHNIIGLGEDLARDIAARLPGAVRIDISRPSERIYVRWEA